MTYLFWDPILQATLDESIVEFERQHSHPSSSGIRGYVDKGRRSIGNVANITSSGSKKYDKEGDPMH